MSMLISAFGTGKAQRIVVCRKKNKKRKAYKKKREKNKKITF